MFENLMSALQAFFNVNTVFFTFIGYPMSYLEFFGTLANIASVWLIARKNVLTWPVGIVAVILFLALFYQIQLYSDMLEQFYFLVTGFWGWWVWTRSTTTVGDEDSSGQGADKITVQEVASWGGVTAVGTVALTWFTMQLNLWLPSIFLAPPSFPVLDALTTVMSFVATILMIRKKVLCWYYWIIVDVIGIGLYFAKDVKFLSLLYFIFLILAVQGLLKWRANAQESSNASV